MLSYETAQCSRRESTAELCQQSRLLFSVHGNKSLGDFRQGGVGSVVAETFLRHGLADAVDSAFIAKHLAAGIDEHTHTHTLPHFPPFFVLFSLRHGDPCLAEIQIQIWPVSLKGCNHLQMFISVMINYAFTLLNKHWFIVAVISE